MSTGSRPEAGGRRASDERDPAREDEQGGAVVRREPREVLRDPGAVDRAIAQHGEGARIEVPSPSRAATGGRSRRRRSPGGSAAPGAGAGVEAQGERQRRGRPRRASYAWSVWDRVSWRPHCQRPATTESAEIASAARMSAAIPSAPRAAPRRGHGRSDPLIRASSRAAPPWARDERHTTKEAPAATASLAPPRGDCPLPSSPWHDTYTSRGRTAESVSPSPNASSQRVTRSAPSTSATSLPLPLTGSWGTFATRMR